MLGLNYGAPEIYKVLVPTFHLVKVTLLRSRVFAEQ